MAFLHDAHDAACRIFGTTLGPEANDAHRNHFHVDMAERKVRSRKSAIGSLWLHHCVDLAGLRGLRSHG